HDPVCGGSQRRVTACVRHFVHAAALRKRDADPYGDGNDFPDPKANQRRYRRHRFLHRQLRGQRGLHRAEFIIMDGLYEQAAAPFCAEIDGKRWEFAPMTVAMWGEMELEIIKRRPQPEAL